MLIMASVGSSLAEQAWTGPAQASVDVAAVTTSNLGIFHRASCIVLYSLGVGLSIGTSRRCLCMMWIIVAGRGAWICAKENCPNLDIDGRVREVIWS